MTKNTHGGKRDGAGRKVLHSEGEVARVTVTVPARLLARLDAGRRSPRSQVVTEAIRRYLASQ